MITTTTPDVIKNEWLQFLEFIKRKYGYNSSEYIRINHYNNRHYNNGTEKSVAQYYLDNNPTLNISGTENLKDLLKKPSFKNFLDLDNPVEISKFTEIYNETDHLMKSLSDVSNNLYIRCNPVNEQGELETTSSSETNSTANSVFKEFGDVLSLQELYNSPGLQAVIGIFFFGILMLLLQFMFYMFPNNTSYLRNKTPLKRIFYSSESNQ